MMYIYFRHFTDLQVFPHKLTREEWDYFVDLRHAESEFDIAKAFCSELYSETMGPLRAMFNENYFNDMMVEFFADHAQEKLSIAVFGAERLWALGGKASAEVISLLHTTYRTGAFAAVRDAKITNIDEIDALVNGEVRLYFVEG